MSSVFYTFQVVSITYIFLFFFFFLVPSSFIYFFYTYAMNSQGMGSSSTGSFPLVLTKCASLGGAGWHSVEFRYFSLGFLLFWSFSFTRFRKLSWLLERLICSIHMLNLLARVLPLTCLFTTMPTAHRVTL